MSSYEKARALGMLIGQEPANTNAPAKRNDMFERAKAWEEKMLAETVSARRSA